jgi:tetratricopeptide (TPR) repeat protein
VPIDRAATLRNAEKLLRQGKLDAAIAEYVRVVEDQPRDWNSANLLGDLYVRAGLVEKGCEQFARIAGSLNGEGFLPKAAALYKKILKLQPDHEHALVQLAEIAAAQGLLLDARAYLNAVLERRQARGDARGASQIRIRLGSLDPGDVDARLAAARARAQIGDAAGAVRDFKAIAGELSETARDAEALAVLREAAALDPADLPLRARVARACLAHGDVRAAAEYLTAAVAGDDVALLLLAGEVRLRADDAAGALDLFHRVLAADPARRDEVAAAAFNAAAAAPDAAYAAVSLAGDAAILDGDFAAAAAALQEFVTRVPSHVPALLRLVEICVDGGLEAAMYGAQAQLADAYILSGAAAEACVIAEDLVAREPWERAHVERYRRALALTGEPNPDAVIAERLAGQSPFLSTDLSFDLPPLDDAPDEPPEVTAAPQQEAAPADAAPAVGGSLPDAGMRDLAAPLTPRAPAGRRDSGYFELSANAIDLESLLREFEAPEAVPPATVRQATTGAEYAEIDLEAELEGLRSAAPPPAPRAMAAPVQADNLDEVFARIRGEAQAAAVTADEEFGRGLALRDAGRIDEAIAALETASRFPGRRFEAASLAGRLYRDHHRIAQAIEWLERAAQAPPPTPGEGHQLLFDLAELLEREGEVARALAVLIELQSDAGEYRDVTERIDRLTKVQTRG